MDTVELVITVIMDIMVLHIGEGTTTIMTMDIMLLVITITVMMGTAIIMVKEEGVLVIQAMVEGEEILVLTAENHLVKNMKLL